METQLKNSAVTCKKGWGDGVGGGEGTHKKSELFVCVSR